MKRRGFIMLVVPFLLCLGLGCEPSGDGRADTNVFEQLQQKTLTKKIAATSYPLAAMAESIAGEAYEVWTPARADKVPTADEMRKLQSSDVLLINGPGTAYATWLPMVTLDKQKIFETTTNSFELADFIRVQEHQIVHSHGGEGEHSHAWMVPHCWLSPRLALLQAEAIRDKLCELYPEDADSFRANYDELIEVPLQEAVVGAAECKEAMKNMNASVVLSDPRLKHLAKAVDLDAESLLWFEPEEVEAAKEQLQELETDGKQWLLWARPPGPTETELIKGLKWSQVDLIESRLAEKSFAQRVKENFKRLSDGIEMATEVDVTDE